MGWTPNLCLSCHNKSGCRECVYIVDQPVNMQAILLFTDLPVLWEIFQLAVGMNPPTDSGFNLMGLTVVKEFNPRLLELVQVTHNEFTLAMTYFLKRMNEQFMERMRLRALQNKER